MANLFLGKTRCALCGKIIESADTAVGFPPFIPNWHSLSRYSDAAFHTICFDRWDRRVDFEKLYRGYQSIMESRPMNIDLASANEWGKSAFASLFAEEKSTE